MTFSLKRLTDTLQHPRLSHPAVRWAALALLSLAVGAGFWAAALKHWDATGFGDWQYYHHQWEAGYAAVMRDGEWPLWDPWHCGGVFLYGDPQAQLYSPFFILALLTGTVAALKLMLIAHTAAGFAGAYVVARRALGTGQLGAMLAGVVFSTCGFFAWHESGGHVGFVPFYLIPWVWLAWRKACQQWRYSAAVAALLALTIFEGGIYPLAYFTVLIAFDGALQLATQWRRWKQVLLAGAVSGALAALMGAFRLWPIMATMADYPRPTAERDVLSFAEVCAMLTSFAHDYKLPGHEYVWAEYGSFIGWSGFLMALVGLVYAGQKHRWLIVSALFFLGVTMGHFSNYSPWALLHKLPVFGSLRVPSRFVVMLVFFLALAAGLALDRWARHILNSDHSPDAPVSPWRRHILNHIPKVLAFLVLVGVTAHIQSGHDKVTNRWVGAPLPAFETKPAVDYHVTGERYDGFAGFPAKNISHRGCYTGMTYAAAPGLWTGHRPQARVPSGTLKEISRTANTITLGVDLRAPGDVVINQTWAKDWILDSDGLPPDTTLIQNPQGLMSVRGLPAGQHTLRLAYAPSQFWPSAALSLLGLCAALAVVFFRKSLSTKHLTPPSEGDPLHCHGEGPNTPSP
jgi:hypothetical protein